MRIYLQELRQRLIYCLIAITIVAIPYLIYANEVYTFIEQPLLKFLRTNDYLIATNLTATFMVPLQLALFCTVLTIVPFILYQIWQFIAPALYLKEKTFIVTIIITSTLLFYTGMLFAYYVVIPLAIAFFIYTAPENVKIMTELGSYLDFIITMLMSFGIAFQLPIVLIILIKLKIISTKTLQEKRRHAILLAFIIGMFLSPPDVLSQTMLAIPLIILFEISICIGKLLK